MTLSHCDRSKMINIVRRVLSNTFPWKIMPLVCLIFRVQSTVSLHWERDKMKVTLQMAFTNACIFLIEYDDIRFTRPRSRSCKVQSTISQYLVRLLLLGAYSAPSHFLNQWYSLLARRCVMWPQWVNIHLELWHGNNRVDHTRAPCQLGKIAGCACGGNAENVFPPQRVCDSDMHYGTCVHVPGCMPESLTSGFL